MRFSSRKIAAVVTGALLFASCASESSPAPEATNPAELTIATAFYPLTEIVHRVAAELDIDVVSLTPPGVGAHDHQLTAQQLDELSGADAVFYLGGGIQPTVEKAVEQLPSSLTRVDLLDSVTTLSGSDEPHDASKGDSHSDEAHAEEATDEHAHGDVDPHVWLDPANMARMTQTVADTLAQLSVANTATFNANASAYIEELNALGTELDSAFATCTSRALVTSHDAFGYFAARAKLTTVPIAGVNPENEPSAKELEDIAQVARQAQATTVFFESLLPDGLAKTVASVIDAKVDVIDPIETIAQADLDKGATYISVQKDNIRKISQGLQCS